MNVDFSSIIDNIKNVESTLEMVGETYRHVEWEDDVHSSYEKFIQRCKSIRESLHINLNRIESIEHELKNIKESKEIEIKVNDISKQCNAIRI